MNRYKKIRCRIAGLCVLAASLFSVGGCFPSGFGQDLVASSVSAVVGDVIYTAMDFILPRPV